MRYRWIYRISISGSASSRVGSKLNTKLDNNPDKQISKAFLVLNIKTLFDIEDDEEALDFIYDSGNDYSIDSIFISDVINDSFTIKIIPNKIY